MIPSLRVCHIVPLLVIGCVSEDDAPFAPETVVTGIYQASTTTRADNCEPRRSEERAIVFGGYEYGADLELFDLRGAIKSVYKLPASQGYTHRVPGSPTLQLNPCTLPSPDSSMVLSYTLTSAARTHLEVEVNEAWTIIPPCVDGETIASVPQSSCNATRTLSYDLVTACEQPCVVRESSPGVLGCTCPR